MCIRDRPYEEQLNIKKEQVKSLLDTVVADGTYEFQGIKASPISLGYRNKMEFSFGDEVKDGPLALGMQDVYKRQDQGNPA